MVSRTRVYASLCRSTTANPMDQKASPAPERALGEVSLRQGVWRIGHLRRKLGLSFWQVAAMVSRTRVYASLCRSTTAHPMAQKASPAAEMRLEKLVYAREFGE